MSIIRFAVIRQLGRVSDKDNLQVSRNAALSIPPELKIIL
jgi:hypothetical protein